MVGGRLNRRRSICGGGFTHGRCSDRLTRGGLTHGRWWIGGRRGWRDVCGMWRGFEVNGTLDLLANEVGLAIKLLRGGDIIQSLKSRDQ